MWANKPEMAHKWVSEHGHAKGYSKYVKNRPKRKKKTSAISDSFEKAAMSISDPTMAAELLRLSILLDS